MKKKVGIFTTNSVDKIHPRIEMQVSLLEKNNFSVDIIRSKARREGVFFEFINLLFLKYFKWKSINLFKKKIAKYDIIHVYDLQLLPLVKKAKKLNKKVVYETLDDNVYLNFHAVSKKIPLLKYMKRFVIQKMANYERRTTKKYCDTVIVNSPNLLANFDSSELIYYASNLEMLSVEAFDDNKQTRFIYLGKLTVAKGTRIYLSLLENFDIELIILGDAYDDESRKLLSHRKVNYLGSFNSDELKKNLTSLLLDYNLIGLSVITPENKSYELQEANKDIDYMSMGIPFIGNTRKPTFDKIKDGAGVLYNDNDSIKDLITNRNSAYTSASNNGKDLYEKYSTLKFNEKLISIYNEL